MQDRRDNSQAGTFREALGRHLLAIEKRDLAALADTVAPESLVLVMSDGKVLERTSDFLEAHRGWFAAPHWQLEAKPIHIQESPGLGVAVMRLDYREAPPGKPEHRQESILTLIFERRDGGWRMVLDQNTPVR